MPLYDFRCADCSAEKEVVVSFAEADSVELVCLECGGVMTRSVNRSFTVVVKAGGSVPPSPLPHRTPKRHTCTDGAVKLSRPNPFTNSLPRENDSVEHR